MRQGATILASVLRIKASYRMERWHIERRDDDEPSNSPSCSILFVYTERMPTQAQKTGGYGDQPNITSTTRATGGYCRDKSFLSWRRTLFSSGTRTARNVSSRNSHQAAGEVFGAGDNQ